MSITFNEFSRLNFCAVEAADGVQPVLAITNSSLGGVIKFIDGVGITSYCHAPDVALGGHLTIAHDMRHIKPVDISAEEMNRVELCVGLIKACAVKQSIFSTECEAWVEVVIESGVCEKCIIPNVSSDFSLLGKKVVVLQNLARECALEQKIHVLCGSNSKGQWQPFLLTNDSISVGTRARF